ncbi:MAG: GAF domain-containing protein [Chloroflexota bacterium]
MKTHILLIDDDPIYCKQLARRLRREDHGRTYAVEFTSDPMQAQDLAAAAETPFHIFLIDHRLGPEIDGIELMAQLKQANPYAEAIILTGYDDAEIGMRAYETGAYGYLHKPFLINELVWRLDSIRGVQILQEIAQETQQAMSLKEVADVITRGSVELGFERARLYSIDKNKQCLVPLSQVGSEAFSETLLQGEDAVYPIAENPYAQQTLAAEDAVFFQPQQYGLTPLEKAMDAEVFPRPVGQWASMALRDKEGCLALLALDNYTFERPIHVERRRLLRLFSHQASAALSRAKRYEAEYLANQASEMVRRISHQVQSIDHHQNGAASVHRLLSTIHAELVGTLGGGNYHVVLKEKESPLWINERLWVDNHAMPNPQWRRLDDQSLTSHLVKTAAPLFLSSHSEIVAYGNAHQLDLSELAETHAWMGTPLMSGGRTIGAIIVERGCSMVKSTLCSRQKRAYATKNTSNYTQTQYKLFREVANQLTGLIQTSWLHELESKRTKQLQLIQHVSQQLLILAEQRDDWLWHAVLTAITAGYGFGFDRAVLFMLEQEGTNYTLCGHMGIGHFDWSNAEQDWKTDVEEGMHFDLYLQKLQSGRVNQTAVEQFVKGWQIDITGRDSAMMEVIHYKRAVHVSKQAAKTRLPQTFIEKFGQTEYALVPVRAGEELLGVVIMDNIWEKEPQEIGTLQHIDRLTDQAGLIYQNVQTSRTQTEMMEHMPKILANAAYKPVQKTLHEICQELQAATQADIVTICPLQKDGKGELFFDFEQGAWLGVDDQRPLGYELGYEYHVGNFTKNILESNTLAINDIHQHTGSYGGVALRKHPLFRAQDIRAFIGAPIRGVLNPDKILGILFINYRTPQNFNVQQIRLVRNFAQMAAVTLRYKTDLTQVHAAKQEAEAQLQSSREELDLLSTLQDRALTNVNEEDLITTLLYTTRKLLTSIPVHCEISLKAWRVVVDLETKPIEYRRDYWLEIDSETIQRRSTTDIYRGLSGQAWQTGQTIFAHNVREPAYEHFYDRGFGTVREIDVPIKNTSREVIGVLTVESPVDCAANHTLTQQHVAMLGRLADTVAQALDNVRRQRQLQQMQETARKITEPSDLNDTLKQVAIAIRHTMPELSAMALWYKHPETEEILCGSAFGLPDACGWTQGNIEPNFQEAVHAVLAGQCISYAKTPHECPVVQRFKPQWLPQAASVALFPLLVQRQEVGVMCFIYEQPHHFREEEQTRLDMLARFVASSVHDSLLLEQRTKERGRHEAAVEIADTIAGNLNMEETLHRILDKLQDLFPDAVASIELYNEDFHHLEFVPGVEEFYPIDHPDYLDYQPIPVNHASMTGSLTTLSLEQGRKLLCNQGDVCRSHFYYKDRARSEGTPFPAHLHATYLPLIRRTKSQFTITLYSEEPSINSLLGVLVLESEEPNRFSRDDELTIWGIAKQIRFALERDFLTNSLRRKDTIATATAWAAEIAHDINRQIGFIRNYTYWLKDEPALSEEGRIYLNDIETAAKTLAGVMAQTKNDPEQFETIDIEPFIQSNTQEIIERRAPETQLTFEFDATGVEIQAHPFALTRIMRGLIHNALEATKTKPETKITIRTKVVENGYLELQIQDNGVGISDMTIRRTLFSAPISTRENSSERGYGLLFASSEIERMKGKIRLLPYVPDEGATFSITIPISGHSTEVMIP